MPRGKKVAASVLSSVLLASCGRGAAEEPMAKDSAPSDATPLKVAITRLEPASIERTYRTSGTLEPLREATLVAQAPGILRSISIQEGDRVRESQVLARLDGRELALQAASAKLQARNLARELERLESAPLGVIPREEIDKQRYAVEEARVLAELSGVQSRQTVVRAPFSGTIVERLVDEGNLATSTTPLFRLADLRVLQLEVHLPERDAAAVELETPVELELVDGTSFSAEVVRRAPVVDPVTGTVKFTLHASSFPGHAMPGAFVRAKMQVDRRIDAPSLPRSAVFEVEGKPHVFVIRDGRARRTAIEQGLEGEDRVEILGGVTSEDPIVLEGNAGITEGMPVLRSDEAP